MMAATIPIELKLKPPLFAIDSELSSTIKPCSGKQPLPCYATSRFRFAYLNAPFALKSSSSRTLTARLCIDAGGATPQQKTEEANSSSSSSGAGYVALFIRMLGLDNDPLDREQAIEALWKYSLGGKKCIDNIMQFRGCINLTVNLLSSESSSACEAAAGLLRSISSINQYRDVVVESGAIEEITRLLYQPSLTSEVKEQSICALGNLSADEKLRVKIANSDILPLLVKFLGDEDIKVKEAAGGVLANLALTESNHEIIVEAGVIPKLAEYLKADIEDENMVIRKEARNALVELAKNNYYRILIIEEGLVPVPLVGSASYKAFSPPLYSWPTLPDGTSIQQTSKAPSRFDASELLLGLNVDENNATIEEAKMKAILGRSKQQFLARSGSIKVEDSKLSQSESSSRGIMVLPWVDGVARLALILELEDESAISRAANAIADASVNEHMRNSFKEAGAIKHLVQLLDHANDGVKVAALGALERLSARKNVCQVIGAEGIISPLISILKSSDTSETIMEKVLSLLDRISNLDKAMKSKFYNGPVNGSKTEVDEATGLPGSSVSNANDDISVSKISTRDMLDSTCICRLVEILKHPSPTLQRRAANILEYVTDNDPTMKTIISEDIESGLHAIFQQKALTETDPDIEDQQPEPYTVQIEEAGLAISAASRLLTKLLNSNHFLQTLNSAGFIESLTKILKSNLPLQYKDWVSACLIKLTSVSNPSPFFDKPINTDITIYDTIPRLIEQIENSSDLQVQEAAVMELSRIVAEGAVDATRAVASKGGIFPLVKVIEEGSERAAEGALGIRYRLSMDSENHNAIVRAGAVGALRRIVMAEKPQWKQALLLLRSLHT